MHCPAWAQQVKFHSPFLDANIKTFQQFIRQNLPDKAITPKLHMLEDDVCPFLRQ